ncbi:MAG: site-specific DNA-methyltransferase [Deltaproteobacteria bacterium]|nr:site-specific DNA-methyltransferase [Deltaproteobacteria bacterium]
MPPKKTPISSSSPSLPIESVRHKDKRANIPTEELKDFIKDDEKAPKSMLYPRDPSLDPQLVWKGKDEQDAKDLEVPVVPVYIQEKIHPQALIEDFRSSARTGGPAQASLFSDFNGIAFEDLIEFYQHEQNWTNRMILGDSLLVMTSLAEKEGLKGKVQTIFMDPPYGIKFGSNWQVSTRKRDLNDGKSEDVTRQPEQIRAFRDTWELGIHSYLSYLRDRFVVGHELLNESGTIFVQIGDANLHIVRCLLDEVFGSENHVATVPFVKTSGSTKDYLPGTIDFILFYAKNSERLKFRNLYHVKEVGGLGGSAYNRIVAQDGSRRTFKSDEKSGRVDLPAHARVYRLDNLTSQSMGREKGEGAASWFPVQLNGEEYRPSIKARWKTNESGMSNLLRAERLEATDTSLYYVRYFDDFRAFPVSDIWQDTVVAGFASDKQYVVETSAKVIERCLLMSTDPGDLVVDPTCGSGTTAYVAEQWGRRWITMDTSRVALALARTRLMAAKFPYYFLADSKDGIQKEAEATGKVPPDYKTENDIRKGFVYKRVPHVTLKAIANNEEIDPIWDKWAVKIDPVRKTLGTVIKKKWEEWEVPREAEGAWPSEAKKLHEEFWRMRRERQQEIDASIARRADVELLYDQPEEDKKRVRVTGPFTVESLSPHRVLATDEEQPRSVTDGQKSDMGGQFHVMILENLKKAGVQNTVKEERLKFDRLEPHAGVWIQGAGEYTDKDGKSRRVAVAVGPQYGTVNRELIKDAALEAVKGIGFDLLVVCGFAFEAQTGEEPHKPYGKLQILLARMNPDLLMGEELLKKTGTGNLFMVFGEPDVKIVTGKDGRVTVEIKGVDVYDPTTGQIRNSSTDDIACWFIDTNYNGESFFVRHAYFTGAQEPYDKLKRAMRAEIDEAAWSALYSTRSRPFDPPKTKKIAIKVINHYGDEVLKVYEVK